MNSLRKLIVCAGVAAPLCWVDRVFSQTFTWVGPANGSFSQAGNWSGGTVPVSGAHVVIDGGAAQNSAVTLDAPTTVRALTISPGDSLTLADSVILEILTDSVFAPNVVNAGTINLENAAEVTGGFMSFSGGGHVNLHGDNAFTLESMELVDQVLTGTGRINAIAYAVGSNSLLNVAPSLGATGDAATLRLQLNDALKNAGRITVQSGGTFSLRTRELIGSGTIEAMSGSTVSFTRDMLIRGGALASQGNGIFVAATSTGSNSLTLQDVSIAGNFRSERLRHVLIGQLNNTGTIILSTADASISLGGAITTLSGGGTLRLNDGYISGTATNTLINQNTITGFRNGSAISVGTLENSGTIGLDVGGRQMTVGAEELFRNAGAISATNGAEVIIGGAAADLDNRFGRISARGVGSRVSINRPLKIIGGFIESDASGEVVFDSPGTLTLDNVTNIGRLRLNGGTLAGDATRSIINSGTITVSGTITLAGTTTLLGSGQFNVNSRISYYGLINTTNRIGGSGEIEGLDNRTNGIVDAAGTQLSLVSGTRNSGLMRASAGGTLLIPTINNTGGRIEAAAGSQVVISNVSSGTIAALAGGKISGQFGGGATLLGPGTFTNANTGSNLYSIAAGQSLSIGQSPVLDGGRFSISGSTSINLIGGPQAITLKDIALNAGAATLNFGPGTINFQGSIVNRVNLRLHSDSNLRSKIMPVGVVTLSGGGAIHGAGGTLGGGRLVNLDNTIYLDGEFFGLWDNGWENYGDLRAKGSNSLLNFRSTGTQSINRGTISAEPVARLDIVGVGTASIPPTLDNIGGRIAGAAGSTTVITNAVIAGGILDGTEGQIVAGGSPGAAPETDPLVRTIYRDVTILGQGVGTGAGRVRTESFITVPAGAMFTVGDPNLDGGQLHSTESTWTGGGEIRVLPRGAITGGGRIVLDDVTMFGAGDIGRGLNDFVIDADSAIVARSIEDDSILDLQIHSNTTNNGRLEVDELAHLRLGVAATSFTSIFGTGSIVVRSGGTLTNEIQTSQALVVNDGTVRIPRRAMFVESITGSGQLHVSGSGGFSVGFLNQQALSLTDSTGSTIRSMLHSSRVRELSIGTLSKLHMDSAAMIVDYETASPLGDIRQLIKRGYAGGSWNGTGISGSLTGLPRQRFGMGYAEAVDVNLDGTVFLMELVDASSVVLRATFAGDADLDGAVNIADFSRLAANFNSPAMWSNGDFNYDGVANISDFSLMASNFNQVLIGDLPRNAVPEPSMFFTIAAAWAIVRRRRMIRRD